MPSTYFPRCGGLQAAGPWETDTRGLGGGVEGSGACDEQIGQVPSPGVLGSRTALRPFAHREGSSRGGSGKLELQVRSW